MESGCPSGGGGYPLSGAPGWGGRSGEGRRGNTVAGRRVVAVAGRGCSSEPKAPSGGRDQLPWAPEAGALLGLRASVFLQKKTM